MDECRDVPNEHGIERGTNEHAYNGGPHLCCVLRRPTTKSNAQHVREGLE